MANKVKFGLRNVYYSVITETADGIEYGTPKQILGAVNMSLLLVAIQVTSMLMM